MVYFIILTCLIIITCFNFFDNKFFKKIDDRLFIGIGILIILLAGLRYNVGFDFNAYKNIHHNINALGLSPNESGMEIGYYLLNIIGKHNFAIVIFLSAVIGVGIKIFVIKEYSENKWITLMMYFTGVFMMFEMGVIRQGIAMSIAFLSIRYIINRNFKKFLLVIAIAMLFHVSALLYIPLYFLGTKQIQRKYIYGIAMLCILISLIDMKQLIAMISGFMPEFVARKMEYYVATSGSGMLLSMIKRVIFLAIFVEFYQYKNINDKKSNLFLNAYFLSIVIMGIFSSIDTLGGRGSMNLYIYQIFIFAILINRVSTKKIKMLLLAIIVLLSVNSMQGILKQGEISNQNYNPYKTIFQE